MQNLQRKKRDLVGRPAPINKVIMFLTASDIFTWSSGAIINALVGLFLALKFGEDAVRFVGIGIAINTLTRGIFEIPIGLLTDRIDGLLVCNFTGSGKSQCLFRFTIYLRFRHGLEPKYLA